MSILSLVAFKKNASVLFKRKGSSYRKLIEKYSAYEAVKNLGTTAEYDALKSLLVEADSYLQKHPSSKRNSAITSLKNQVTDRRYQVWHQLQSDQIKQAPTQLLQQKTLLINELKSIIGGDFTSIAEFKTALSNHYSSSEADYIKSAASGLLAGASSLNVGTLRAVASVLLSSEFAHYQKALSLLKLNPSSSVLNESSKAVIAKELAKFPPAILDLMQAHNIEVIVTHDSITSYLTHLKGVAPRGWPPGSTWDTVPGIFSPNTPDGKAAPVLAVILNSAGQWVIPPDTQGSSNVVLHETAHAIDRIVGQDLLGDSLSNQTDFWQAWHDDYGTLGDEYYRQGGNQGGREETFAEGLARYYEQSASLTWNDVNNWLSSNPFDPLAQEYSTSWWQQQLSENFSPKVKTYVENQVPELSQPDQLSFDSLRKIYKAIGEAPFEASDAPLAELKKITSPVHRMLRWDAFSQSGALGFRQAAIDGAGSTPHQVRFAPQSMYVELGQQSSSGICEKLGTAYLYSLSQGADTQQKNKLLDGLFTHSAILQVADQRGEASNRNIQDANQFEKRLQQLPASSDGNIFSDNGNLHLDQIVQRLTQPGNNDIFLQLTTGNHALVAGKKLINNQAQLFLYDPNFGEVTFSDTDLATNGQALKQTLQQHLNKTVAAYNGSLKDFYQTQTNNQGQLQFAVKTFDAIQAATNQLFQQLTQQLISNELILERKRLARLDHSQGKVTVGGLSLDRTTLYDLGAKIDGSAFDSQLDVSKTDVASRLSFDSDQLISQLSQPNYSDQRIQAAKLLKQLVTQQGGVDASLALFSGSEQTKTQQLLQKVNQYVATDFTIDNTLWTQLSNTLTTKNRRVSTINSISNRVGKGVQGFGYYQGLIGLANAFRRKQTASVTDQADLDIQIGTTLGGFAADITEPVLTKGLEKLGQRIANRMASSVTTAGRMASSLGKGIARAGGAVLGVLTSGFDIYSAVDAFSKLNSETDPKKRQDLIVNGSLSVTGAVTGIATAVAIGIGGAAAAVAGPIGVAVAAVLAIGGQMYSAIRQIDEIDDYISLTTDERLRNGWLAFWGKELDEDITKRYGEAKAVEQGRPAFDKGLRESAANNFNEDIDTVVYSEGTVGVKTTSYIERVKKSGGVKLPYTYYENVTRYNHEPILEKADDNVDLSQGIAGGETTRYFQLQSDGQGNTVRKAVDPHWESYQVKVGEDFSRYYPYHIEDVYETRYREILPTHDLTMKSYDAAGSNVAALANNTTSNKNSALINLGDGNDTAKGFTNKANIFVLGNGKKNFTGGNKNDVFTLTSEESTDQPSFLEGGAGSDTLILGTQKQQISNYRRHINLDNGSNDGAFWTTGTNHYGAVAFLSNIENVVGDAAVSEEIQGNKNVNVLDGRGGNDVIRSFGGNDIIYAHAGDQIDGGLGVDTYYISREAGVITIKEEIGDEKETSAFYVDFDISEIRQPHLKTDKVVLNHSDIEIQFVGDNQAVTSVILKNAFFNMPGSHWIPTQPNLTMVTRDGFLITVEWPEKYTTGMPAKMSAAYIGVKEGYNNFNNVEIDLETNTVDIKHNYVGGYSRPDVITKQVPAFIDLKPVGSEVVISKRHRFNVNGYYDMGDRFFGDADSNRFELTQGLDQAEGRGGQDIYVVGQEGNDYLEKTINNNQATGRTVTKNDGTTETIYDQDYLVMAGANRKWLDVVRDSSLNKTNDLLVRELNPQDTTVVRQVRVKDFFVGITYQHISVIDAEGVEYAIDLGQQGQPSLSRNGTYFGTTNVDEIQASTYGEVTVFGQAGDDKLTASSINTTEGGDTLIGGAGNDQLTDSLADDRLIGGDDNDVLLSSQGDDLLMTGNGQDEIRFNQNASGVKVINQGATDQQIDNIWVPFSLNKANYWQEGTSLVIEGQTPNVPENQPLVIVIKDYYQGLDQQQFTLKQYQPISDVMTTNTTLTAIDQLDSSMLKQFAKLATVTPVNEDVQALLAQQMAAFPDKAGTHTPTDVTAPVTAQLSQSVVPAV